ncbi:type I-C CRISPR-associated endonuclease Cas1c [Synoicihabitans lomoniglobus]|uniref:CRISPR-associated endonuclease Cas1 n=1 Tax=Synoicihabitans lomoniglobus TaxID=2909285 RepID=A0AAF0CNR2_9BACT|nr:type I-C CRISPR-associated endonuclease Cas1c [Opitutaceae bacterium LMO-M01]WED64745.1 type I-C CRISPR-associated endonuclease Cas1c [Opitutaceae bacterium LMO-M01]
MRKHLNTLYVTLDDSYLQQDGESVAVRHAKETKLRVPLHNLDGIVTFGWSIGCSPQLMATCSRQGVTLSFCDGHGRFQATAQGFSPGNVLLRRTQYRAADDPDSSLAIARHCVAAKLANSRQVLLRGARDHGTEKPDRHAALTTAAAHLAHRIEAALTATDLDALRGVEGDGADTYFQAFNHLLTIDGPTFRFTTRSRRPPLDPINALLSFLYSLLAHDLRSACEASGLDAAVGFLHRDRPGRAGLALDLMEEFRAVIADRLALTLINRRQLTSADFVTQETGAVTLKEDSRKTVLVSWQERKAAELRHPFLDEKTTWGLLPHLQARLLARHLRGDLDAYPAFLLK